MGESRASRSAWVAGSPYSTVEMAAIQGSLCLKKVSKFTMPNRLTPAANRSGYSVTPAIVM